MSFKISDKKLLKRYNRMWKRIEKLLEIKSDIKPVYGNHEKYIKTKIKTYGDGVITNFHGKKRPKKKALCKCLSVIMPDSVFEANKKYYPQVFLEECKHEPKRIKRENLINDDLEKSESNSDSNDEAESDIDNEEKVTKSYKKYFNNNKSPCPLNWL